VTASRKACRRALFPEVDAEEQDEDANEVDTEEEEEVAPKRFR
jgi:hypothetical protein